MPGGLALVQTVDFFTPVVDDPYAYGQIAAANALSDVYAMGGKPLTVLNIACFNPMAAAPEVWASVLRGMYDKTVEAGAVVLGGHSVEDNEPKFGMAVTGLVDPSVMFANTEARVGDSIILTKPLGTGIVTTAAKNDGASEEQLKAAINSMSALNSAGADFGLRYGVRCATDVTGFGLAGHLYNIARASGVSIEISVSALPRFEGLEELIAADFTTGGSVKNRRFLDENLIVTEGVSEPDVQVVLDPQTSGGLALFNSGFDETYPTIGKVVQGSSRIILVP